MRGQNCFGVATDAFGVVLASIFASINLLVLEKSFGRWGWTHIAVQCTSQYKPPLQCTCIQYIFICNSDSIDVVDVHFFFCLCVHSL